MKKPTAEEYDDYWSYEEAMYAWFWSWAGPALGVYSIFLLVAFLWVVVEAAGQ